MNWHILADCPPTEETAPNGFWAAGMFSGTVQVSSIPWHRLDFRRAEKDGWTHWQPVVGPVGLPQKPRPKLPDGWHWDGKRIVRQLTQTYWSAPEQQTTSSTTTVYHVVTNGPEAFVWSTDGGGIPVWAVKALQKDGQI